jgi:hypothetical protein
VSYCGRLFLISIACSLGVFLSSIGYTVGYSLGVFLSSIGYGRLFFRSVSYISRLFLRGVP